MNEIDKNFNGNLEANVNKAVTDKEFRDNIEEVTEAVKKTSPSMLLRSLVDNKVDQLQTKRIDSTENNLIAKNKEEVLKYNNHNHAIHKETNLPIILLQDKISFHLSYSW